MIHTIATVRATLESRIESDEPDEVLAILKKDDGKQLTKRILETLPSVGFGASLVSASGQRWRLSQHAGMIHLETWDYARSGGSTGIHLLMAYAEKSVTIDAAWVEEHNPAYFKGRRERNAARRAALGNHEALTSMALALNKSETAKAILETAKSVLDECTQGGFAPDSYEWERLCGAREERS